MRSSGEEQSVILHSSILRMTCKVLSIARGMLGSSTHNRLPDISWSPLKSRSPLPPFIDGDIIPLDPRTSTSTLTKVSTKGSLTLFGKSPSGSLKRAEAVPQILPHVPLI